MDPTFKPANKSPVKARKPAPRAASNKLTSKQETFARLIASGLNQSDAYRKAYDASGMSSPSINSNASKLSNDHRIMSRVEQLRNKQAHISLHEADRIRQAALETIYEIAINCDNRASDRLRAAELLGKVRGIKLFDDNVQSNQSHAPQSMRELEQRIKLLLTDQTERDTQVIDIIDVREIGPNSSDAVSPTATPPDRQTPPGED